MSQMTPEERQKVGPEGDGDVFGNATLWQARLRGRLHKKVVAAKPRADALWSAAALLPHSKGFAGPPVERPMRIGG